MGYLPVNPSSLVFLWSGFIIACLLAFRSRRRPRYPPGPSGLAFIGNYFDVPQDYGWIKYREYGQQYGSDIIHLQVLGSHIVVVNSVRAANDLFEKRSSVYSDKQQSVMVNELTGWDRNWAFMEYGDYWRQHRRLFHQHFRPLAVPQYHSRQAKGVHGLLRSLLDSPEDFVKHIRFMAGSTILDVVYSFDVEPGDPKIDLVEKGVHTSIDIINGVFLVDIFPALKRLPSWFPGAGFKRQAAKWKTLVDGMYEIPYYQFKASILGGSAGPCLASTLYSGVENTEDMASLDEVFIRLTGTAYAAGSDTTVAALSIFVLAMTIFPETQLAAQEELDRVLGRKRLPEIEDREFLPHITAMVHEVLRWHSPLPLGLPHRTIADDEYNGHFIPAGTVVIGNSWAMLHDESLFPDPDPFKPERFLKADGSLRDDVPYPMETFGFGRRICAGRYFAHDILWLAIANILTVFTIEPPVDENGKVVKPKAEFTPRVLSVPVPFKTRFNPRFPEARTLIHSSTLTD